MELMLKALFKNCGKPQVGLGKLLLYGMNIGHGTLSEWGLSQIKIPAAANVLDIGCGGGANLRRLAKRASRGLVCGIDISECSLECSRKKVSEYILDGRCQVKYGSAEKIPFPDGLFDVVTAFETVYFWKDMESALREVRRVLKEGGLFLVVNEASDAQNNCWSDIVDGMTVLGGDELRALFEEAGFSAAEVVSEDDGRICVIGAK